MALTGLVTAPVFSAYDPGPANPERTGRMRAVLDRVDQSGLGAELISLEAPLAELSWIEKVHDPRHVEVVRTAFEKGVEALAEDTPVTRFAFEASVRAVGGVLAAADRIVEGSWRNGFVASRPPGHHAEYGRAMGFCFFNAAVICARYLQERYGVGRVAILDWDVHHGNGSQYLTERDASVLYASLHQSPHYPWTGAKEEKGIGEGEGTVLNCPMSAGSGDREYLRVFEGEVLPAIEEFAPEFVVLSAGFDPHVRDPLSGTEVTREGFKRMSEGVLEVGRRCCGGKVLSVLEGGYDLEGLAEGVEVHLGCLVEEGKRSAGGGVV